MRLSNRQRTTVRNSEIFEIPWKFHMFDVKIKTVRRIHRLCVPTNQHGRLREVYGEKKI